MHESDGYQKALSAIDRFVEALQEAESPFEFATTLVKATAQQYKADIATLFRVSPSRTELIAEAGYDQKGEKLRFNASYPLRWNAKSQDEMKRGGLTPWVAVSGDPLFIRNAEELLRQPAHRGAWDPELHPDGPESTFGCLYAVPLRVRGKGRNETMPQESVFGVYKIERRQDNPEGMFTNVQVQEFDLAAKQLSLVILLYEQAMARILSDARHAVAGRLADAINQLDIVATYLDKSNSKLRELPSDKREARVAGQIARVEADADKVQSWLRQSIRTYMNPIESEERSLEMFVKDTIEARANQQYEVSPVIAECDRGVKLRMSLAQSWDLHTLLLSLLNNSIQHSNSPETVALSAGIDGQSQELVFMIEDAGRGIKRELIEQAESEAAPTGALTALSGTGLRRAYRVAKFRQWKIDHESRNPGTRFRVFVTSPDLPEEI